MTAAPGPGRYLLGLVALALLAGALGFAAVRLRRRFLPALAGAPCALATTVIALALLTALMELLGTLDGFSLLPLTLAALVGAAAVAWRFPTAPGAGPGGRTADHGAAVVRQGPAWVRPAIIGLGGALIAALWLGPTLVSYQQGIRSFDSLWYHLPWAASFAQSGQIATLHFTDVEYLTAFYPAGAELIHGLGIVLLGGDALSPGLNLSWLGLVLLAAYCVGEPFGLGPATLLGAVLAMATPMVLGSQAGTAANDVVAIFFVLAALAFIVRSDGGEGAWVLAAVAAGLAVSVKLSVLAPVATLTVGALLLRRDRRSALLWLVPLFLAGGYWYARNLIAVGNPLPWLHLPLLATPAEALQQHTGFSVAHYLGTGGLWTHVWEPGIAAGLGPWWWAVLALAVIGPVLCLLPGAGGPVRLAGTVALVSLLAYLLTPETAAGPAGRPLGFAFNLRYAAPGLTVALVAVPLAPALRRAPAQTGVLTVIAAVIAATVAQTRLWPSGQTGAQVIVGVVVLGAILGIAAGRARPWPTTLSRPVLAAVLVLLAVPVAALGYAGQRNYFSGRYRHRYGVSQLARTWARFRRIAGARVGIVGTYGGFFAYPLAGLRDTNPLVYIGNRGPHGSFTPITSCAAWRRAVNAARLRYLVTTPARDPWAPKVLHPSPERGWTAGDPAASIVVQYRVAGQAVTVFALRRALDPSCAGSAG